MLSAENVKTFYIFGYSSEPNVQHEETPQPPPENPPEGIDEVMSPPGPEEQQKDDITFFTSFEAHFGQFVSCLEVFMLWSAENFSLHFKHIYSYIGIFRLLYSFGLF